MKYGVRHVMLLSTDGPADIAGLLGNCKNHYVAKLTRRREGEPHGKACRTGRKEAIKREM